MGAWNPRWAAYAHSIGATPDNVPSGADTNAAYMGFISRSKATFEAETGFTRLTSGYQTAFTAWLTARHPAQAVPA